MLALSGWCSGVVVCMLVCASQRTKGSLRKQTMSDLRKQTMSDLGVEVGVCRRMFVCALVNTHQIHLRCVCIAVDARSVWLVFRCGRLYACVRISEN